MRTAVLHRKQPQTVRKSKNGWNQITPISEKGTFLKKSLLLLRVQIFKISSLTFKYVKYRAR